MPRKYFLHPKPTPGRFISPRPFGIIEGAGCLHCFNCVKKNCPYEVFKKRKFNERNLGDTADSLCRNCFRCVQSCYGRILLKTANPEYWLQGDEYWTPEIIASNRAQAETGRIPVSGGGYNGPFAGPHFDSMWTDMSEIVRPTRDGIHGREYISTAVDLGKNPGPFIFPEGQANLQNLLKELPPRVEISLPLIGDLLPLQAYRLPQLAALGQVAQEVNTLMIVKAEEIEGNLEQFTPWLIPFLPALGKDHYQLLSKVRLVQVPYLDRQQAMNIVKDLKKINPQILVIIRIPLSGQTEDIVLDLVDLGGEIIHLLADEQGKVPGSPPQLFLKDMIRKIHLRLVKEKCRDQVTLIFGGGIALAEHLAKAIICGADLVSIDLPLLLAMECRLCRGCLKGRSCPVEIENADPAWARQRVVNLLAAWHGQILEVLGAMGIRDVRRLRGESGRAIFLAEIEQETFGQIFGPVSKVPEENYVSATQN